MVILDTYSERPIEFLEVWGCSGWRIKIYGLAWQRDRPEPQLIEGGKELAAGLLPAVTPTDQAVGFMGIHQGRDARLVFLDWWADQNELHHHVWLARGDDESFEYASPGGLLGCVWDLVVIGFERKAWIDTMLAAPIPDVDRYLATTFSGRF
jgi:hypothetical protein